MIKMVKRKSSKKFNWQGITENGDGTFTTVGKREKRRVLKALHEQGVAVRSKQNSDGSWTVTPVGSVRVKAEPRTVSPASTPYREPGRRLNTRETGFPKYPRSKGTGRPMPGRGSRPLPTTGGPVYRGGPRASGPSPLTVIGNKAGEYLRKRQEKKQEEQKRQQEIKKLSDEMSEKWKKEESEKLTREQKEEARKQMEKDRLRREAMGLQPGDLKTSLHQADVKAEQRRTDDAMKRQQEQRQQRQESRMSQGGYTGGSTRAPEIPKQKVDPATLQHARENAVKGDD
jgi:hypothetical protein